VCRVFYLKDVVLFLLLLCLKKNQQNDENITLMSLENSFHKNLLEAGCDEAGRGCLAGPVFAAAVILPKDFEHPLLNDSKKLNEKTRLLLKVIIEKEALAWAVVKVDAGEIDKINILRASIVGMQRAVDKLKVKPEFLLIDGNKFTKHRDFPHKCIVKGDGKYANIAAASILAKTYRDEFALKMHEEFPVYEWNKNKAYPTKFHRDMIQKHGITPYHRTSFKLFENQLNFDF